MAVKRIVANVAADQFESVKAFYCDILQMKVVMDFGSSNSFVWLTKAA